MRAKPILRNRAQLACAGVLAAVAIAGCGSSSSTSTSASASTGAPGGVRTQLSSKVTACLKEHGVTLPSGGFTHRPSGANGRPPSGGSGSGAPPTGASGKSGSGTRPPGGGFAGNSKIRAALQACGVGGSSSSSSS